MSVVKENPLRKSVKTDVPLFRDRLRAALVEKDISQRQLALSMGKDPRTVNHVFKGPVHPDLGTLKDFCEKLGVSADWLLGLSENKDDDIRPRTLHRFSHLNDICTHDKRWFSIPTYAHPDSEYLAMAPMPSDSFEPNITKGDLLTIDMSVNSITSAAVYVTAWKNEPETKYVNYMLKMVNEGVSRVAVKWLNGTKGERLGLETTVFDPEDLIVYGGGVGRYTESVL